MKKYSIIYIDPPWSYKDKSCQGAAEKQYKTLSIDDLCRLPINDICADDCIMFLWATYPLLPEALQFIKSHNFTYKSIGFQWIKTNPKSGTPFYGLGRWTRGNTEPCLIATKGKPKRVSNSVFQLIQSPIGKHSKKPDVARDKIVQLIGDLPRIELFARQRTEGWDAIGYDLDGKDIFEALKEL